MYDAETEFYYNRHRYYDAESGQYLSPDPIGL
ncbi:RHS repeat-associated core domain-containing protein [Pectobacterium parmentieri]|nr:RHS repeat-associated core domain-containing protein [Pectobacterium parmentieri]